MAGRVKKVKGGYVATDGKGKKLPGKPKSKKMAGKQVQAVWMSQHGKG